MIVTRLFVFYVDFGGIFVFSGSIFSKKRLKAAAL